MVLANKAVVMVIGLMMLITTTAYGGGNFRDDFKPTFGDGRVKMSGQGGQLLSLSLDQYSGSGFCSKKDYLFGRIDMQIKLVAGDSAGTVTTFYLSSDQSTGTHDEIDFEFLGNSSGQPYTLHTNVFGQGKGGREQQFHLWFDPTKNFHTYTIVWNTKLIMFMVDNAPIRVFRSNEDIGVPFPKNQPMKIYSSLWNADDWATQGGRVKTNWTKAPFTAYYRNFNLDACDGNADTATCSTTHPATSTSNDQTTSSSPGNNTKRSGSWRDHDLDANGRKRLRWAQKYFMVYDYCKDAKRYPQGYPAECKRSRI